MLAVSVADTDGDGADLLPCESDDLNSSAASVLIFDI